jgi:hypothetical protein
VALKLPFGSPKAGKLVTLRSLGIKHTTMKIRLKGNSICYCLDKTDIELLQELNKVEEITHIGEHVLRFCIRAREIPDPTIRMDEHGVHLAVPLPQMTQWMTTDQVGFNLEITNPDQSVLHIQVEKDA